MRVFVDFHHSSLLRSLVLLFENRLGLELYRPIGMDWYKAGFWGINDQEDTAKQFLDLEQAIPKDGTPPLNLIAAGNHADGIYMVLDPGGISAHKACTFDYFINNQFDYVIASIPAHVEMFKHLIAKYQRNAKLIIQMGNNWHIENYTGHNVMASIAPQTAPDVNAIYYHQEFDLKIFHRVPCLPTKRIHSYVNLIQKTGIGWTDYKQLKRLMDSQGFTFSAYGGQCPDGNMTGPLELAHSMALAQFIFHVKPGGDGFGHIIHNAYAVGRPIITRPSHYKGQLAEQLLVPGTFIDLDRYGPGEIKNIITRLTHDERGLMQMGDRAAERFREVVNYNQESINIAAWLLALP